MLLLAFVFCRCFDNRIVIIGFSLCFFADVCVVTRKTKLGRDGHWIFSRGSAAAAGTATTTT